MSKNLSSIAKTKKIKYFLISFVDLFGVLRSKLVPASAISGMQKDMVSEFAAKVRAVRPPEPYKGKGIRYRGEYVRSKQGKTLGAK